MFDHITTLLQTHNCVIVPGLGGFVAEYKPAQVHPVTHEFSPPAKSIAFNPQLTKNDGLLAQQIATSDEISFEEAGEKIRQFAKACSNSLREQKRLRCPGLGKLVLDLENRIQFHPDVSTNLLGDAFGLTAFVSQPISRSKAAAISNQQEEILARKPLSVPKKPARRRKLTYVWASAAALLTIFLFVQLFSQRPLLNIQYADLFFWQNNTADESEEARLFDPPELIGSLQEQMRTFGKTSKEDSATNLAGEETATEDVTDEMVKEETEPEHITLEPVIKPGDAPKAENANAQPKTSTTASVPGEEAVELEVKHGRNANLPTFQEKPVRGYYCIVGSYRNQQQAQARLKRLPEGNHGTAVLNGRNGYYRAGIFIDADAYTAEIQLKKLRQEFSQPDAWIVKY